MTPTAGDLPPMAVDGRLDALRRSFGEAEIDAALVTHLPNIRYLTGFTGSAATLLVTDGAALFVSDGRYRDQAADELASAGVDARVEISNTEQREIITAAARDLSVIGLESDTITWGRARTLTEDWFPDASVVPTSRLVESLRDQKDPGEVARIEAAAAIADEALQRIRHRLAERLSEREIGLELDHMMRSLGAEDLSFETIVAAGPNGAKPHARPGDRTIEAGDLVVMDFGAVVDGYHSDMTRTFAVGDVGATEQRMLDIVGAAQQAGVDAVGPGVELASVDHACRSVIEDAGWGEAFLHSTGHGVGLDVHEHPRVSKLSEGALSVGQVVTVEPGVYLPDHGGVRIEDTVVVTPSGCRALTRAPKVTDPLG